MSAWSSHRRDKTADFGTTVRGSASTGLGAKAATLVISLETARSISRRSPRQRQTPLRKAELVAHGSTLPHVALLPIP